jgi:3-hydroxymyristoyl/3-hydroxydecanoyl-(acyl carrier protein) dehydratase
MPRRDEDSAFESVAVTDGIARAVVRPAHVRRLCDGHFPGDPIVPGSALAGLMADVAARLDDGRTLRELVRCAFHVPVVPDDEVEIVARRGDGGAIEAEVRTGRGRAARARLRLAAR